MSTLAARRGNGGGRSRRWHAVPTSPVARRPSSHLRPMTHADANATSDLPALSTRRAAGVARFPKARFGELLRRVPSLEQRFVSHLADRVRDATRRDAQFEKLTALGRLSAGLAHELNNPASAVQRSAAELAARVASRAA